MPTSVLLAVLVAAGMLALAPALVRRYDADERIAADRASSTARVLERGPRGRTGPGANPINPPSAAAEDTPLGDDDDLPDAPVPDGPSTTRASRVPRGWERSGAADAASLRLEFETAAGDEGDTVTVASAQKGTRPDDWWRRRYRRVLYVLLGLCLAELVGVIVLGPGFWLGFGVALALLLAFLRFLRLRAIDLERERRLMRRERELDDALDDTPPTGQRIYVPEQADGSAADTEHTVADEGGDGAVDESAPPATHHSYLFGDGDLDDDYDDDAEDDRPAEPPARRGSGIRGRSYESPAAHP